MRHYDLESLPPDDAIDDMTYDSNLNIDCEADCDMNHSLMGRQNQVFYDNGGLLVPSPVTIKLWRN